MTVQERLSVTQQQLVEAKTFDQAIPIIPKEVCFVGVQEMQRQFLETFPDPNDVSVVPIARGGLVLGDMLTEPFGIATNPMRMSYYDAESKRLPAPVCKMEPDINQIIVDGRVKPVAFVEAVVETQSTIAASISQINSMINAYNEAHGTNLPYPEYHTFAFILKNGTHPVNIPDVHAMFRVHPAVWVFGMGCDLNEAGRDVMEIQGVLSPYAEEIPEPPFFTALF